MQRQADLNPIGNFTVYIPVRLPRRVIVVWRLCRRLRSGGLTFRKARFAKQETAWISRFRGKGFFAVQGPSGPLYTRNGSLRISPAGALTSSDGYPVRLAGGGRLQVSSGTSLEIQTDGTIRQDGSILGRLDLVDFAEPNSLAKVGNNYFRATDPGAPTPATATSVEQGALEDSNVGTAESAIRIVGVMRQFEMLQKAVSIGAEMNRKAVEEVARVGA